MSCITLSSIAATYQHAGNRRPCCISGDRLHQYCRCPGPLSKCKLQCDQDPNCKGYAAWNFKNSEGECQFATSSTKVCPSGCTDYATGNIGALRINETCGGVNHDFGGCYIKFHNGMYIITPRLSYII